MKLILLPGMHGTGGLFGPFCDVLPAGLSRRIVAYPTDQQLSPSELLEYLQQQLVDETEPLLLLGESYSGAIAVAYAAAHSDQVAAVVLSAGFVTPPWPSWIRFFIHAWLAYLPLPDVLVRFLGVGDQGSPELIDQIRREVRQPKPRVIAARARDALTLDVSAQLRACTIPILYLLAEKDRLVWPRSSEIMLQINAQVKVHRLAGPHLLLQTMPAETWHAIESFVNTSLSTGRQERSQLKSRV